MSQTSPYYISELRVGLKFEPTQSAKLVENWYSLLAKVLDECKHLGLESRTVNAGGVPSYALSYLELVKSIPRIPRFVSRESEVPAIWVEMGPVTSAILHLEKLSTEAKYDAGVHHVTKLVTDRASDQRFSTIPLEFFTSMSVLLASCEAIIGGNLSVVMTREIGINVNEEFTKVELPKISNLDAMVFGPEYKDSHIEEITLRTGSTPSYHIHATKEGEATERVRSVLLEGKPSHITQIIERELQDRFGRLKSTFLRLK